MLKKVKTNEKIEKTLSVASANDSSSVHFTLDKHQDSMENVGKKGFHPILSIHTGDEKKDLHSQRSDTDKESSPLKRMMGFVGRRINDLGKGIGSGIGTISKGIGSGLGTITKGIGSGVGAIGKGIGYVGKNLIDKRLVGALGLNQLGKGLNFVSKGLKLDLLGRGLGTLSKGLGLDMLGKGLKLGMNQLGRFKDLSKGLDLKQMLMRLKGANSAVLTEKEKKIQFIKGHLKRSDTIAAILALLCLILSYYEVVLG